MSRVCPPSSISRRTGDWRLRLLDRQVLHEDGIVGNFKADARENALSTDANPIMILTQLHGQGAKYDIFCACYLCEAPSQQATAVSQLTVSERQSAKSWRELALDASQFVSEQ